MDMLIILNRHRGANSIDGLTIRNKHREAITAINTFTSTQYGNTARTRIKLKLLAH